VLTLKAYSPKCLQRLSENSEGAPFRGLRSLRDGVRDAPFDALCHTDKRAVRPVQLFSRQFLEGKFSEVRTALVLHRAVFLCTNREMLLFIHKNILIHSRSIMVPRKGRLSGPGLWRSRAIPGNFAFTAFSEVAPALTTPHTSFVS
jgi:hypothetical protein